MKLNWDAILSGELEIPASLLAGILLGELILRPGAAEKMLPLLWCAGVGPVLGLAPAVSADSSKAGAALPAAALEVRPFPRRNGKIYFVPEYNFHAAFRIAIPDTGSPAIFGVNFLNQQNFARHT